MRSLCYFTLLSFTLLSATSIDAQPSEGVSDAAIARMAEKLANELAPRIEIRIPAQGRSATANLKKKPGLLGDSASDFGTL